MHFAPLIRDLAVILAVAAIVTFVFHRIKQPVVLGYIIAGLLIGPHTPPISFVSDLPNIQIWAELGVIFLMFTLGLEFSFRKLGKVGASAGITGLLQIAVLVLLGYACGQAMDWTTMDSIFLGAMISISSTTIIIKALDELKLKSRRFAELIFGILIVEDLVAILLLVMLTNIAVKSSLGAVDLLMASAKLFLVVGSWFLVGYFIVPRFVKSVGKLGNNEMLTILAVGLCLSLVSVAAYFHYSVALGAFIMGSILAETSESRRIEHLVEPLRDIFGAVFFVSVGMLLDPKVLFDYFGPILVITMVVIVGKIISVTLGALTSGQTLKTSVQTGFGMAQIGEFSFIIAALGHTLKVTSEFLYPVIVAVSLLTTLTTPYLIKVSGPLAEILEAKLPERIKRLITEYALLLQRRALNNERKAIYSKLALRWISSGILVTLAFIFSAQIIFPQVQARVPDAEWAWGLSWVPAMVLSSPFLWSMFSSFHSLPVQTANVQASVFQNRAALFVTRILTIIWVAVLSAKFFSAWIVVAGTFTIMSLLFFLLYRRLGKYYEWFEKQFLSAFEQNTADGTQKAAEELKRLAPWDAHLVRTIVHPDSELVGQKLINLKMRERFGLNIVALKRGNKTIVAPTRNERIYPRDELLFLGTDEQIEKIKPAIESPKYTDNNDSQDLGAYEIKKILIDNGSFLSNRTILDSKIRDEFGGMVVGIERDNARITNPTSDFVMKPGDVLWVVGDANQLKELSEKH